MINFNSVKSGVPNNLFKILAI